MNLLEEPLSRPIDNKNQDLFLDFKERKKEAILSLVVLLIPLIIVNSLFLFTGGSAVPIASYTFDNVIHNWRFWGVLFILPVFLFLLIRKQRISTVGIRKVNTWINITISLIIITFLLWVRIGFFLDFILGTSVFIFWLMEKRNFNSNEITKESILEDDSEKLLNKVKWIDEVIQGLYLRPLMFGTTLIGIFLISIGPYMRDGYDPMRELIFGFSFIFFLFASFIVILKLISWKFSLYYSELTRNQYFDVLIQSRFLVLGSTIVVVTSIINYTVFFFTNLLVIYLISIYFILMMLIVGVLDIFLVVEFFYYKIYNKSFLEGENSRKIHFSVILRIISICSALGILLYVILGGVFDTGEPLLSYSGLYGLLSCFAIGLGEELLFRGLIQFRFVEWLGEKKGVIMTSIIFALMHLPMVLVSFKINLATLSFYMIYLFLSSVFIGFLVSRTKNISGAIILHTVADLI